MGTGALRNGVQSQPGSETGKAQQKAMLKGGAFPDVPMTLMKPLSAIIPAGHRKRGSRRCCHAPE